MRGFLVASGADETACDTPEVLLRALEAALRLLFEAAANDPIKAGRNLNAISREFRGFFLENRIHRFYRGVSTKGATPGSHLVQDCTEAEDVGTMVEPLSADLLRGHVADGTHHRAGGGGYSAGHSG
jgi:hypothetical protein